MSSEHTQHDEPEHRAGEQTDCDQSYPRRQFLRAATAAGLSTTVAGCSSVLETDESELRNEQTESPNYVARVVLDGTPNGLRKFKATIRSTSGGSITDIEPGVIDGEEFQVVSGGVGQTETTVRAVDLSGSVGTFNDSQTLVIAKFDSEILGSTIDVSTSQVTDDDGEAIPEEKIDIELTG